ncbi:hypothetical protein C7419_104175 [Cupriavidus plantarum]|uniref:Uncharacterized protein n=1 Tax=Cupriavidus plantarum TaxID=942865 RepID=A0A316EPW2_9BURK|nr:hypothetical protein C7419_104175 [Cupriavidus plantarum]
MRHRCRPSMPQARRARPRLRPSRSRAKGQASAHPFVHAGVPNVGARRAIDAAKCERAGLRSCLRSREATRARQRALQYRYGHACSASPHESEQRGGDNVRRAFEIGAFRDNDSHPRHTATTEQAPGLDPRRAQFAERVDAPAMHPASDARPHPMLTGQQRRAVTLARADRLGLVLGIAGASPNMPDRVPCRTATQRHCESTIAPGTPRARMRGSSARFVSMPLS